MKVPKIGTITLKLDAVEFSEELAAIKTELQEVLALVERVKALKPDLEASLEKGADK